MSQVAADALKRAGFNVEMRWADWLTAGQLLRKHDGWNLFLTGAPGAMMFDPLTNIATDMSCDGKNFIGRLAGIDLVLRERAGGADGEEFRGDPDKPRK